MCLLDGVVSWDETQIQCHAESHGSPSNPLRSRGRLGILCGIEYAGQAMAVHGRLVAGPGEPRVGYLAALRAIECHERYLDHLSGVLAVGATRLNGDATTVIYGFALHHDERLLLQGRATVVMRPGPASAANPAG